MRCRRALLVATYDYDDAGLRRLTAPAQDAEELAAVLEDPAVAGFEVDVLINKSTYQVGKAIADFYAAGERDDLTLLYFSGHGLKDDNGRLYLAMKNTEHDSLRFTALSAQQVDEAVAESPSRQKVLILDCCYSGAYAVQQFAKADSAVHTGEALGGRGRTVLTAADSTQYAFEGSKIHGHAAQSVFTRHVVEGLRSGAADLDFDGDITVDELYSYVYDAVVAEHPNQRPKQFSDVEGRTVIASNVHWQLPEHITTLLASPLPTLRQTGLEELGQLLQASNERVRRTARSELEGLRADDCQSIAEAARALLEAPPARPQRTAVDRPTGRAPAEHPTRPTVDAVAEAAAGRWRGRLTPPALVWPIFALTLLAAAAAISAAVLETTWYLVAVAALMTCATVAQFRLREAGASLAAGLAAPGVVGTALLVGWLADLSPGRLPPVPAALAVGAHTAWLVAGAIGLYKVRSVAAKPQLRLVVLGVAAAALLLVILVSDDRPAKTPIYASVLSLLAAELAVAGPLFANGRTFLSGWVFGGFAIWIGLLHEPGGFVPPKLAVAALFAVWLLLGIATLGHAKTVAQSDHWVLPATLLTVRRTWSRCDLRRIIGRERPDRRRFGGLLRRPVPVRRRHRERPGPENQQGDA
jgi:hypothetical protein